MSAYPWNSSRGSGSNSEVTEVSPIKAVYCFNYTQLYYYEKKLSIEAKYWSKNTKRAKETGSFPGYIELNSTLNTIENAILSAYRKYKNDNKQERSVDELGDLVKVERGISTVKEIKQVEFMEFVDAFIKEAEEGKHINLSSGKPVSVVTVRTYKQTV
jgi:hypothetical protein